MTDYSLDHLSARSFEQLTQSLALKVLGSHLTIFGDGPDGGREASFEGRPNPNWFAGEWNGFGILQSKFRQEPDPSPKQNADWLCSQLKSEFKRFASRPADKGSQMPSVRYCPEYYIVATNIRLSAVENIGGKDRVAQILDSYQQTHGLKGYAIWDGDQIARLLDLNQDIRTTYAAWILPSDVLSAALEHFKLASVDFQATIHRFLASELLEDQHAKLGQGGYKEANTIPLSTVFVDLPIEAHRSKSGVDVRPRALATIFDVSRECLRPSAGGSDSNETRPRDLPLGRIVLIGGPGQGKTTIGQFACQIMRAELLKRASFQMSPEVAQAARSIMNTSDIQAPKALRYPIRIDLKKFAEAISENEEHRTTSLLDFLVSFIGERTDTSIQKQDLRRWLAAYPWMLVLDGLDEVPASSNRQHLLDAIHIFVSVEAAQQDADLLVVATTRPQGYSAEFNSIHYRHLQLSRLSTLEALNYGEKLACARHPFNNTRFKELTQVLARAANTASTARLMESPLQVTIMLALIEGGGDPPEDRWRLFRDYYEVIYRREKERGTAFSRILRNYESDINWIHHRAGWLLQQRNSSSGLTASKFSHVEFEEIVDSRLQARGHTNVESRRQLVMAIRDAATDRLVFLVGTTAAEVGFELRSLQEFMAAEHLFDGSEACVQKTMFGIAESPYWRNVFLFLAGRILHVNESLIDSLIMTCNRHNLSGPVNIKIKMGSWIAATILDDGGVRNQPGNSRDLAECAASLFELPDDTVVDTLLACFHGQAAEVWTEKIDRMVRDKPTLHFDCLWIFCLKLAGTGNAWASELVKSKFPWEYRGLGRLFKAAFGTESWAGLAEILKGDFFFLPPRIWLSLDSSSFSSIHCRGPLRDLWEIACRNWPKPVDLLGRLGEPLGFQLLGAGDGILQRWAALDLPLTEIPKEADSAWFAYGIVSDFARNPTPHNLTELLGVFFEKWEKFDPPEDIVPWQFARCIDAARNGTPVLDIIDAIEAHRLGTEHEWKQWADLSDGVRLTWLGVHREHICVERGFLGPAFRNATWLYSPSRGHIVDYFRALGNALPSLDPRSEIALKLMRLACFSLYNHAENWTEQILGSTWSFIRQCSKLNIEVPREFIAAVLGSELSIRAKLNLLTQVPLKFSASSPMHEWKSVLERIKRRIDVLSNLHSEEIERILVPLSYLPPIQLPYLLRSAAVQAWKSATGRELSIAGMALSLGNFQLANMTDSSEVALHALRMKNHRGHFLSELIDDLDSGSGELVEGVLLKLLELLPQDSSELRAKAFRALVNVSQRRPAESRLADPRLRELE